MSYFNTKPEPGFDTKPFDFRCSAVTHSIANKQGEKTALRVGENNSKWSNWQRINLKNIQAAHAAQFQ